MVEMKLMAKYRKAIEEKRRGDCSVSIMISGTVDNIIMASAGTVNSAVRMKISEKQ